MTAAQEQSRRDQAAIRVLASAVLPGPTTATRALRVLSVVERVVCR